MTARHTTGPLSVVKGHSEDAIGIQASNGEVVAIICTVYGGGTPEGNAQLFAAAEDLLNACKAVLAYYQHPTMGGKSSMLKTVREAVAKAEATP